MAHIIGSYTEGISIQVSLNGYSFKVHGPEGEENSGGWLSPDRIFTTKEFQRRHKRVSLHLMTPKCTLVPKAFFDPTRCRQMLADVAKVEENDMVEHVEVPHVGAVLIYSNSIGETLSKAISKMVLTEDGREAKPLPETHGLLEAMLDVQEYNKVLASVADGWLHLVIAQGKSLLLANVFPAADFTTAEYFIFNAMKKLQMNPEVSSIHFRTPISEEEEMSLYRYFKSVERI